MRCHARGEPGEGFEGPPFAMLSTCHRKILGRKRNNVNPHRDDCSQNAKCALRAVRPERQPARTFDKVQLKFREELLLGKLWRRLS
jgi:hypothetical protein